MSEAPSIERSPGPNELRDPMIRAEFARAMVWASVGIAIALVVLLIQPLLIIFGGLVFAAMLEIGVRGLGVILPLPRQIRLAIVMILAVAFIGGVFYLAGVQISAQAGQLRETLTVQANHAIEWLNATGLMPERADLSGLAQQALGSVGKLTSAVGSAVGAVTSLLMVVVIGLFIAIEPNLYDRGLQWMVPLDRREEFAVTIHRMAEMMRRLLAGRLAGMAFEGVITWLALWLAGVPMALLLGIITGLLAFIPNIGAFVSGVLMVSVGFSQGVDTGIWAIIIYFAVQNFDGYVVIPMIAKQTVDLPPALTLSSQILASTLFGVMGLALADPMVAMVKVALQRSSERARDSGIGDAEEQSA